MSSYKAPIGRSFYSIPYQKEEDLQLLRKLSAEANKLINSILSSNSDITNELALVLALINVIYENQSSLTARSNQLHDNHTLNTNNTQYSTEDIISIIDYLNKKILELENAD